MELFTALDKKMKKLHWYHLSALKLCVLAFALWFAKLWPIVLIGNVWVYAIIWIGLGAYLLWTLR